MPRDSHDVIPLRSGMLICAVATMLLGNLACAEPPKANGQREPRLNAPAPDAAALLRKGDQFATQKKYNEALIAYKGAYERILPSLRERSFRRPVAPRIMSRPELEIYMAKEFQKQMSAVDLLFLDRTVKLFGLAPAKLDVQKMMLDLFTEEVAGFYNSETKEMFLILETPKAKPGLFEKVFGQPKEFDADDQKSTLAHEMTHALADQHFDLNGFDETFADNEDAALAISALIEGEATLVMLAEMVRADGGMQGAKQMLHVSPARVDRMFRGITAGSAVGASRAMRAAPPFFRKSMVFPYHQGSVFVAHLMQPDGAWKSVDRAFRFPPVSTEQILHPEKYLGEKKDWPVKVTIPALDSIFPKWTKLGEDSLGEFQTRLLLDSQADHQRAAAGWDGDRYVVCRAPEDEQSAGAPDDSALLWFTTWDTEDDAKEFFDCLGRAALQRHKRAVRSERNRTNEAEVKLAAGAEGRLARVENGIRGCAIQRSGRDVVMVEGLEGERASAALDALMSSRKSSYDYRLPPVEIP